MLSIRLDTWWISQSIAWPRRLERSMETVFFLALQACVAVLAAVFLVFVAERALGATIVWRLPFVLLVPASMPAVISLVSTLLAVFERSKQEATAPPQPVVAYVSLYPATVFAVVLQTLYRAG